MRKKIEERTEQKQTCIKFIIRISRKVYKCLLTMSQGIKYKNNCKLLTECQKQIQIKSNKTSMGKKVIK